MIDNLITSLFDSSAVSDYSICMNIWYKNFYEQEYPHHETEEYVSGDCFEWMNNNEILKDALAFFHEFYESKWCMERLDKLETRLCKESDDCASEGNIDHELMIRRTNLVRNGQIFFDSKLESNNVVWYYVPVWDWSGLLQESVPLDYHITDQKNQEVMAKGDIIDQMTSHSCEQSDYSAYVLRKLKDEIDARHKGWNIVVYSLPEHHDAFTIVHELGHRFVDESIVLHQKTEFNQQLESAKSRYMQYMQSMYSGDDAAIEYVNHEFDSGEVIADFFALRYFLNKIVNLQPWEYISKKHILWFYNYIDSQEQSDSDTIIQCKRLKLFLEDIIGVTIAPWPVSDMWMLTWFDERIC